MAELFLVKGNTVTGVSLVQHQDNRMMIMKDGVRGRTRVETRQPWTVA